MGRSDMAEMYVEFLFDGCKGYNNYTDVDLLEEFKYLIDWENENERQS